MADRWPFCFAILMFFAHYSKMRRDRDFIFESNMGFWGMANLVVILPMMSDSKWPTGSHFVLQFRSLLITPKPIEIETSLFGQRRGFGVWRI